MRRLCRCPGGRWDEHRVSCIYSDEFLTGYPDAAPHPRARVARRECEMCGGPSDGFGSLCSVCDDFVWGAYRDWLER